MIKIDLSSSSDDEDFKTAEDEEDPDSPDLASK